MTKRCAECGEHAVMLRAVPDRHTAWRQFGALPIAADVAIPTCSNCGSEWFDSKTALALDGALELEAAKLMSRVARKAIDALAATVHQRDLERQLGLSGGYISKLKHGKEIPSAHLVAALCLLAARPARLKEVERIWETGQLPPRVTANHFTSIDLPVDGSLAVAS